MRINFDVYQMKLRSYIGAQTRFTKLYAEHLCEKRAVKRAFLCGFIAPMRLWESPSKSESVCRHR